MPLATQFSGAIFLELPLKMEALQVIHEAMQLQLKTYYRMEFLPLIVSFVTETARCLGATPKEISELGMASDEAGMHIVERFPGDGLEEQFEVVCEVCEEGLRVVFSNMGLPVNPQALPKFAADQPEETIDGLGLFLIEKLVDRFEFVNQGRAGWRTVMVKKLAQLKAPVSQPNEEAGNLAASREKLRIVQAGLEHVPGIVELAYRNYGYSYSKDLFYYADRLRAAIAGGKIESFIALNPENRVVGQMAILYSANSQDAAEVGAVMIQPEYRRSMGLLQLLKVVNHAVKNQDHSLALVEANLVTTHTLSQKVCGMFHFKPMALKLSVHGRAKFLALAEEADRQRETLLHAITILRPVPPVRLFVPPRHLEITRKLFAGVGISIESSETAALPGKASPCPLPAQTMLNIEKHADSALAVLSIQEPGLDCAAALRAKLFDLESDGMKTVFIRLPGWHPQPADWDREARALRIFFSGWVVEAPDRWWLLYTRLNAQRFDFGRIQLCDPLAMELRTYVETCFHEAVL
ncbi:MAG: hypothetical protein A2X46_00085 [Lentisphaerae bacterium GWF2_57_35]|nr:MAG: hypothetical protein A2X46_00085 [Lentisphaerae bacterium GWF2_57_35]